MLAYVLPIFAYVFAPLLASSLKLPEIWGQVAKIALVVGLLIYFRKSYSFKPFLSLWGIGAGLLIFALWVGVEGRYPYFMGSPVLPPTDLPYILVRLVASILIAPIVEEYFTRFFLNRYLQSPRWEKIPLKRFTILSFIVTVAFFSFAHTRWLPAIFTGIILNLLLMRTGKIEDCVWAHAVANLVLAGYVIYFQAWTFWG